MQRSAQVARLFVQSNSSSGHRISASITRQHSTVALGSINFQKPFTICQAPSELEASERESSRRPPANDITLSTSDPRRASLAARLAVPQSDTPVVSSSAATPAAAGTPIVSRPASPSFKGDFSSVRFKDFVETGQISQEQLGNIPFEFATEVQAKTLGPILNGNDVLARAKTGTGKTLAFLVPAIEAMRRSRRESALGVVSVLIVSPTRELAQQIGKEAKTLTKGMNYGVEVITGGGPKVPGESNYLQNSRVDILVATPGRLVDHIQNYTMRSQLSQVQFLILDEADRLLDQGFRRDLEVILGSLPDRKQTPRQSLLFSATVSEEVKSIGTLALLPGYEYISTVSDNESSTHEHVKQEHIIVNNDADVIPVVARLIEERSKVICFLPTARATALIAEVMENVLSTPVYCIHSKLTQPRRTKATEDFKRAPTGVLFSSDVTARGIDIPGVTCVIQAGLPANAEQYIHRLGRTARAGNDGHGVLVLAEWERFFLGKKDVCAAGLDQRLIPHADTEHFNETGPDTILESMRARVKDALNNTDERTKEQAYIAWIGYYKGCLRDLGWSEVELVQRANDLVRNTYLYRGYQPDPTIPVSTWIPPPIFAKTIGMMGLREVRKHNLFNVVSPEGTRNQGQGKRGGRPLLREDGHPDRGSAEPMDAEVRAPSGYGGSVNRGRGRGRGRGRD
ncbi:DEAD/DEAH box helicase [Ceratobasidium sp. AG-Ba]|nr:DEAD/DEAH box helicase [Ceratobasidium sp. AG-Ba]